VTLQHGTDSPSNPPDGVDRAHQQAGGTQPKRSWTVHLLVSLAAGPLLGAALFAWAGSMDLSLAALLMVVMIPVAFAVSALAMPRLIWLVRFLWRGVTKGLIFAVALTGWRQHEAPPPNEYLIHLQSPRQSLIEGFFGPLNLYFRPSKVFSHHNNSFFSYAGTQILALFYVGSFIWLPLSFLSAVALVGFPSTTTLRDIGLISGSLTILGLARGFSWTRAKPRRYELHPDLAWAFAIYFNVFLIFDYVLSDAAARTTHPPLPQLANGAQFVVTIVPPTALALFFALSALFGSLIGARRLVQFGAVASPVLMILLLRSQSPFMVDLAVSLVAMALISTHVAYQPAYFAWSAAAGWLVRAHPDWSERLWRWSPVRLTEYVYVPQPGTAEVVRRLKDIDPQEAARAVRFLCHHPFQSRLGFELRREWLVEQELHPITP